MDLKNDILLCVEDIKKHFASTIALDQVSLTVRRGEVRGLIGENGSGKSTLSSIIAGIQPPTSGKMWFNGAAHSPSSTLEAQRVGVGMIIQELGTVSGITVAENIFLGREREFSKGGIVSRKSMIKKANEALEKIGIKHFKAEDLINNLDMQDRKLVEVAKIMWDDPDLLIVDESTTALSQKGRAIIYNLVARQQEQKKAVLFISHDLDELMQVCTCLTVLRDGKMVGELDKPEFSEELIKQKMIGREMSEDYYPAWIPNVYGEIVLEAEKIHTLDTLKGVSLQLHKGEILGICGLSHCGMHPLGKILFGAEKPFMGTVRHTESGEIINSSLKAMKHGMGYVSKDRDHEALVLQASIKDNISICGLDKMQTASGMILYGRESRYVDNQIKSLSIKCASPDQYVCYLSGGNKQKVVFGKWVGRDADILILDCPTRGVDIGVKAAMYHLMGEMRAAGKSIIMISEELPELINMSDRLVILKDGIVTKEINDRASMTESYIIDYMI